MSTTVVKNRPFYEREDLKTKLASLDKCEHDLQMQQAGLKAYNELFTQYRLRFSLAQTHRELAPEELQQMERMWQRLSVKNDDPAEIAEQQFLQRNKELRKQSAQLWKKIVQTITERSQILESWYEHIEDISYRLYLLSEFGKKLETLEAQIEETTNQSWMTKTDGAFLEEIDEEIEPLDTFASPRSDEKKSTHFEPTQLLSSWKHRIRKQKVQKEHDLRRNIRIEIGTKVGLKTSKHQFYTGFTENISSGGVFIATYDFTPNVGERFTLSLQLPNETKIDAICEVAWVREYLDSAPETSPGFGCIFLELSEKEKQWINQCIENSGSMFMPPF